MSTVSNDKDVSPHPRSSSSEVSDSNKFDQDNANSKLNSEPDTTPTDHDQTQTSNSKFVTSVDDVHITLQKDGKDQKIFTLLVDTSANDSDQGMKIDNQKQQQVKNQDRNRKSTFSISSSCSIQKLSDKQQQENSVPVDCDPIWEGKQEDYKHTEGKKRLWIWPICGLVFVTFWSAPFVLFLIDAQNLETKQDCVTQETLFHDFMFYWFWETGELPFSYLAIPSITCWLICKMVDNRGKLKHPDQQQCLSIIYAGASIMPTTMYSGWIDAMKYFIVALRDCKFGKSQAWFSRQFDDREWNYSALELVANFTFHDEDLQIGSIWILLVQFTAMSLMWLVIFAAWIHRLQLLAQKKAARRCKIIAWLTLVWMQLFLITVFTLVDKEFLANNAPTLMSFGFGVFTVGVALLTTEVHHGMNRAMSELKEELGFQETSDAERADRFVELQWLDRMTTLFKLGLNTFVIFLVFTCLNSWLGFQFSSRISDSAISHTISKQIFNLLLVVDFVFNGMLMAFSSGCWDKAILVKISSNFLSQQYESDFNYVPKPNEDCQEIASPSSGKYQSKSLEDQNKKRKLSVGMATRLASAGDKVVARRLKLRQEQTMFNDACHLLKDAPISESQIRRLNKTENQVRQEVVQNLKQQQNSSKQNPSASTQNINVNVWDVPSWQDLTELCKEEQSRLASLMSEAWKAYQVLSSRLNFLLKIKSRVAVIEQQKSRDQAQLCSQSPGENQNFDGNNPVIDADSLMIVHVCVSDAQSASCGSDWESGDEHEIKDKDSKKKVGNTDNNRMSGNAEVTTLLRQPLQRSFGRNLNCVIAEVMEVGRGIMPKFNAAVQRCVDEFNAAGRVSDLNIQSIDGQQVDGLIPFFVDVKRATDSTQVQLAANDPETFPISSGYTYSGGVARDIVDNSSPTSSTNINIKQSTQNTSKTKIRAFYRAGPLKKFDACLRKVQIEYAKTLPDDPASLILDVVRGTVVFACPYQLALFYAFLTSKFQVLRVKNRFTEPLEGSEYRDLLINILFTDDESESQTQQIVELQLSLEIMLALKRYQHKPYAVLRHASPESFIETPQIFKLPV